MAIQGKDAANKEPNFIPEEELLPRDNSGGADMVDHRPAKFGDGGFTLGGGAVGTGVVGNTVKK